MEKTTGNLNWSIHISKEQLEESYKQVRECGMRLLPAPGAIQPVYLRRYMREPSCLKAESPPKQPLPDILDIPYSTWVAVGVDNNGEVDDYAYATPLYTLKLGWSYFSKRWELDVEEESRISSILRVDVGYDRYFDTPEEGMAAAAALRLELDLQLSKARDYLQENLRHTTEMLETIMKDKARG